MKALTLDQPWASLIAVGAKTIETRGFATSYRGPLLIHAGKHPIRDVPRDRGPFGDYRVRMVGRTGAVLEGPGIEPWDHRTGRGGCPLPLGAVVATCQLIDCIPIIDDADEMPLGAPGYVAVNDKRFSCDDPELWRPARISVAGREPFDGWQRVQTFHDERPFGDFTPGRYAWLLGDVKPTTERCPRCWGAGTIDGWPLPWEGSAISRPMTAVEQNPPIQKRCPTCITEEQPFIGEGRCAPVPMRGRQGLWIPNADDWSAA